MKIYYEESDLVSFGKHLLSEERTNKIGDLNRNKPIDVVESLVKQVHHFDLQDWKEKQKTV